jgi:hypothetical protein
MKNILLFLWISSLFIFAIIYRDNLNINFSINMVYFSYAFFAVTSILLAIHYFIFEKKD